MTDAREHLLRKVLQKIAFERKHDNPTFETSAVPTTGANFTSQLFHATIKSTNKENLDVFAKVAAVGKEFRDRTGVDLFATELNFYTKLDKVYKGLEDKYELPEENRLVTPKLYGHSNEYMHEVLALQDLSKDGFITHDRLKSYNWKYASSAVEQLAKFHALSLAYEKENPEDFKSVKDIFCGLQFVEGDMMDGFEKSGKVTVNLTREENKGKLQKFLEETNNVEAFAKLFGPQKRSVIAHSDYRMSNLLHKKCENGKVQVIIVDYQTLSIASVSLDLLYFIFTGSDGAFRAKYYDQLIDHYYENLAAALRRLHLDPEEVFPRAYFDEELKEMLPFGLLIACTLLPLITVDIAHAPKMEEEGYDDASFAAMTNMIGKTNDLCAERVNEVVDDFVRWGVI